MIKLNILYKIYD